MHSSESIKIPWALRLFVLLIGLMVLGLVNPWSADAAVKLQRCDDVRAPQQYPVVHTAGLQVGKLRFARPCAARPFTVTWNVTNPNQTFVPSDDLMISGSPEFIRNLTAATVDGADAFGRCGSVGHGDGADFRVCSVRADLPAGHTVRVVVKLSSGRPLESAWFGLALKRGKHQILAQAWTKPFHLYYRDPDVPLVALVGDVPTKHCGTMQIHLSPFRDDGVFYKPVLRLKALRRMSFSGHSTRTIRFSTFGSKGATVRVTYCARKSAKFRLRVYARNAVGATFTFVRRDNGEYYTAAAVG